MSEYVHPKYLLPAGTLYLLGVLTLLCLAPVCASAATQATPVANTTGVSVPVLLELDATQSTFQVPVVVTSDRPYAGAEFAWQCAPGLSLTSVSYPTKVSHAGPVEARGLSWFSYFSGTNDFEGTMKITATFTYTGRDNARIYLDHAELMTRSGVDIKGKLYAPRVNIEIKRAGAVNVPPTLEAPPNAVPAGSRNDGKTAVDTSSARSAAQTAQTESDTSALRPPRAVASGADATTDSQQERASRSSAAADDAPTKSGMARSASSSAAGAFSDNPAILDSDNSIRAERSRMPNLLGWLAGVSGGLGALVLGYIVIQRHRRDRVGREA
ncbi:MAG: hypothetical protein LBJ07_04110 [Actinomycetes bacterium]|jgi:hypothetical protein|nr:hypothetical protein [Actinomycetes bacterium]